HGRIVFVHPVVALFGLVERDAECVVPAQNFTAIVEPGRERHFRRHENWPLLPQLGEKGKRLSKNPAAHEGPTLCGWRRVEAIQIAPHVTLQMAGPCRAAAWESPWEPMRISLDYRRHYAPGMGIVKGVHSARLRILLNLSV